MSTTLDTIQDIIVSTQSNLGKAEFSDNASTYQEYVLVDRLIRPEHKIYSGGKDLRRNALMKTGGSAENVGLYGTSQVTQRQGLKYAITPWFNTTANYAIDRREITANSGAEEIVDLVTARRAMATIDMVEKLEINGWNAPTSSSDDLTPRGIPYWIVKNASEGFNGGNPSGFSDCGGIDSSAFSGWNNYTAQYATANHDDMVRKLRKAYTLTGFVSPASANIPAPIARRFLLAANYTVVSAMEEIGEQQNDQLGNDIASMDGVVMFRKQPVIWVSYLDSDTSNPIYGLDLNTWKLGFLQGEYMREETFKPDQDQHTVYVTHLDNTYGFICDCRRRNFVVSHS